MKNLIYLLISVTLIGCSNDEDPTQRVPYDMEGKWIFENNSLNTMYLYEAGIRYTYYCTGDDCESQYESFEAADGNHIPGTNNYTFENEVLTVDLNFGNELVTPITFECYGGKAYFEIPEYSLVRLSSDCN